MEDLSIPAEYRFSPGMVFDDEFADNPRMSVRQAKALAKAWRARGKRVPARIAAAAGGRRRRRRGRRSRRVRGRKASSPRRKYRTRRHRRNARFGRHRPTLYYTGRGWRATRRSRLGIKGHRVNRRRRRGGRHRRNPVSGGSGYRQYLRFPGRGDFGRGLKGAAVSAGAFIGGLAIPGLTGYAYNMAFDAWLKDPIEKVLPGYSRYIKDGSRLGVKAGVTCLSAWGIGKITRRPAVGRIVFLGGMIGLLIDGIATLASYAIGYNNPFGKAVVMRGMTPKPSYKSVALNAFGLGEAATAWGTYQDVNLAKNGVRIMQHPSGQMGLLNVKTGKLVMSGKAPAVLGRYHRIMSARSHGLGEMITVESGMPWRGEDPD